ncbi:addiction module protein [Paludisphaera rhizosphaerae]|uniref:addiction module protein n=1 Tax=Paludisphaera rhizosphaerae TaxID=2711216 RepID=UPI0013EDD2D8|nr:addiction module protein [Paludisphaera rhizosphaerae]
MALAVEEILAAALALSDVDRPDLIEALLDSVDSSDQPSLDESWREEIQRRSAELATGAVKPVSWTEVKRRARESSGG